MHTSKTRKEELNKYFEGNEINSLSIKMEQPIEINILCFSQYKFCN